MSLKDTKNSYGWISIALHWFAAILIIALWFIGDSTNSMEIRTLGYWGQMHVSIAMLAYVLFIARIVWRLKSGHPRLEGQGPTVHLLGKVAHYLMLILIVLMLISGPIKIWALGATLSIFSVIHIPSPTGYIGWLANSASLVHLYAGNTLIIVVTLHLCAAMKHLMFHDDETFVRMLFPRGKDED